MNIVDPTPDKKWLRLKAEKEGYSINFPANDVNNQTKPSILCNEESHGKDGWTKQLIEVPPFSFKNINDHVEVVNKASNIGKTTVVKKKFYSWRTVIGGKPHRY